MQGMCIVEDILKVHVCFLKRYHLMALYVIFRVYITVIYLR